jgi:hypothetical protein
MESVFVEAEALLIGAYRAVSCQSLVGISSLVVMDIRYRWIILKIAVVIDRIQ